MVVQQAKIALGNGDVLIGCTVIDGQGVLYLNNQDSMAIGEIKQIHEESIDIKEFEKSPMILTFSNKESIDAFIKALRLIRPYTEN